MFKHQLLSQFPFLKILSSVAVITSLGFTVTSQRPVSALTLTPPIPVDTELSLLIDVSSSISSAEYALQMGAYQSAFTKLAPLFGTDGFGSVAVNLIQWSSSNQQQESIPWTLINDQASANLFAETVGALVRSFNGFTAPSSAINFAVPLFSSNDYEGERWVIDVSGDGLGNSASTSLARDAALDAGVSVINGLPILTSTFTNAIVLNFYKDSVQGGDGSFVIAANGFEDIDRALEQKLRSELTLPSVDPPSPVTDVPGPTNILGIVLLGGLSRLKRRLSAKSESA